MIIKNFDFIEALKAFFFPRDRDITLQEGRTLTVTAAGGVSIVINDNGIEILAGDVTIDGTSVSVAGHAHTHASTTGQTANDHHNEAHTVASHSDTTATGVELETLTDSSNADSLHTHAHASTTGKTANDHHNEAHTVASHSDTTATGAELETLTDGSNADALHAHAVGAHTIASHSDTTATGAELETLTDGSDASTLHDHDGRYFQESEFSSNPGAASSPLETNASGILFLEQLRVTTDVRLDGGVSVGDVAVNPADGEIDTTGSINGAKHILADWSVKAGGGLAAGSTTVTTAGGALTLDEISAPSTPSSGFMHVYAKTDGKLYYKNDGGTEEEIATV